MYIIIFNLYLKIFSSVLKNVYSVFSFLLVTTFAFNKRGKIFAVNTDTNVNAADNKNK